MNETKTAAEIPVSLRDFVARAKERLSLKTPANLEAPASLEELTEQQGDHQVAKNMADILAGRFRQTASGDALLPWAGALSLLGRVWFPARDRGTSDSELMKALWASPHNWDRAGS